MSSQWQAKVIYSFKQLAAHSQLVCCCGGSSLLFCTFQLQFPSLFFEQYSQTGDGHVNKEISRLIRSKSVFFLSVSLLGEQLVVGRSMVWRNRCLNRALITAFRKRVVLRKNKIHQVSEMYRIGIHGVSGGLQAALLVPSCTLLTKRFGNGKAKRWGDMKFQNCLKAVRWTATSHACWLQFGCGGTCV